MYTIPADLDDPVPTTAHVENISRDGRRLKRSTHLCFAPSARNATDRLFDPFSGHDYEHTPFDGMGLPGDIAGVNTHNAREKNVVVGGDFATQVR